MWKEDLVNIGSDPNLIGVMEIQAKGQQVDRRLIGFCDSFLQLPDTCIKPKE